MAPPPTDLDRRLAGAPYQGYAYAYPHKTAYRALERPVPLAEAWRDEDRRGLFLYVHVPFCEFRCGFCNLFTQANPGEGLVARYLDALEREAEAVDAALGPRGFARVAVGGGTPTQLDLADLARVFDLIERLGARPREVPAGIEVSPDTVDADKLRLLRERGVDRVSMGVQSFLEDEARAAGRPQRTARVLRALDLLAAAGFPRRNLDLIYGLPGQDERSFARSLERLLEDPPEEVFLYPLYVRPLTGLARRELARADDLRQRLYRLGRARLLAAGYAQVSMRCFQRPAAAPAGPPYSCQEDGMVGLGCGARSYTRALHYSGEYAVGARGVQELLAAWVARDAADHARASYGFRLDSGEQRRRFVIQSLLQAEGLDLARYARRFAGGDPLADLPQLAELAPRGLAVLAGGRLALTAAGLELSDVLGPWLASARVAALMQEYELR